MGVKSKWHLKAGVANHNSYTSGRRRHDTLSSNSWQCGTAEERGASRMPLQKARCWARFMNRSPFPRSLTEKTTNSNASNAPSAKWAQWTSHSHLRERAVLNLGFPVPTPPHTLFLQSGMYLSQPRRPSSMQLLSQGFPWDFSHASLIIMMTIIITIIFHNSHYS